MTTVYVSVGSNVDPADNIRRGIDCLQREYGQILLSPVYRTRAVGFDGDDFLNLAASFETNDSVQDVDRTLDEIENECGRDRREARFGPRTLDLDLLLYGDLVLDEPGLRLPRDEILEYAFVLRPLADLAPGLIHPTTGNSLAELWAARTDQADPLIPVPFVLQP
mgnify:CR=1 FL=1